MLSGKHAVVSGVKLKQCTVCNPRSLQRCDGVQQASTLFGLSACWMLCKLFRETSWTESPHRETEMRLKIDLQMIPFLLDPFETINFSSSPAVMAQQIEQQQLWTPANLRHKGCQVKLTVTSLDVSRATMYVCL